MDAPRLFKDQSSCLPYRGSFTSLCFYWLPHDVTWTIGVSCSHEVWSMIMIMNMNMIRYDYEYEYDTIWLWNEYDMVMVWYAMSFTLQKCSSCVSLNIVVFVCTSLLGF